MLPLTNDGSSTSGAQCLLHAGISNIVQQQIIHLMMDLPGVGQLFFHSIGVDGCLN